MFHSKKIQSRSSEQVTEVRGPRFLAAFSLLVAAGAASCGGDARVGTDEVVGTQTEALTTISDMRRTPIANPVTFSGSRIRVLYTQGSRVYMGGSFSFTWNGQTYNNLAAFDMPSSYLGIPTVAAGFRPQPNGQVWSLATDGARLYVGGDFTTIAGSSRTRLAAVNLSTGAIDTGFTANTNGRVQALGVTPDGTGLIVGGSFTTINGTSRSNLGAVERQSGAVSSRFTSGASGGTVSVIKSDAVSGNVFIGGAFTNYQNHANLVATDMFGNASGAVFQTGANPVLALDFDLRGEGQLFAGLGGSGNSVVSFRATGPSQGAFLWQSPIAQGDVQAVHFLNGGVYFGFHDGLFVNGTNGQPGDPYKLAGVSSSMPGNPPLLFATTWPGGPCTAADSRGCWAPMMDPAGSSSGFFGVWALTSINVPGAGPRLLAGGEFTRIGAVSPTKFFGQFPTVP
jgi:hypothetical protein